MAIYESLNDITYFNSSSSNEWNITKLIILNRMKERITFSSSWVFYSHSHHILRCYFCELNVQYVQWLVNQKIVISLAFTNSYVQYIIYAVRKESLRFRIYMFYRACSTCIEYVPQVMSAFFGLVSDFANKADIR